MQNFRIQELNVLYISTKKKSLFLITQFYIIKLAVLDSGIVTVGVSSSGANSIRHSASINRIIYLYIRNTVQIHNNLNIFNIGLIKMKVRWKVEGTGKGKSGVRWMIRKITTISRMKNNNEKFPLDNKQLSFRSLSKQYGKSV